MGIQGRFYLGAFIFVPTFFLGTNAGIWQIKRRREKIKRMKDFENLDQPPLTELPTEDEPVGEYTRIHLEGTYDNEGSVLVGPRPLPSHQNRIGSEEQRGGFLVMTPLEVANTRQMVMVNRGWVPIDACKSRLHLVQYIGEGFKPVKVRGILRREEYVSRWFSSDAIENHMAIPGSMSWQVVRPFDMTLDYLRRRFGPPMLPERQVIHGARHFFIEVLEDMTGDDQVLVRGKALPARRPVEEVTYVALLPVIHTMYSVFWFCIAGASMWALRKSFNDHRMSVVRAKVAERQSNEARERMARSASAHKAEVQRVLEQKAQGISAESAAKQSAFQSKK